MYLKININSINTAYKTIWMIKMLPWNIKDTFSKKHWKISFEYFALILYLIIASITGILNTLKSILRAIIGNPSDEISFAASPVSVSVSHYLQIQQAEISFSVNHQGINDIFAMKSITKSFFSNCQRTWRHYNEDITVR